MKRGAEVFIILYFTFETLRSNTQNNNYLEITLTIK